MSSANRIDATCVGLSQFCAKDVAGFRGVIKTEPDDFQVREVDEAGQVVDLDAAQSPALPTNAMPETAKKTSQAIEVAVPDCGWEAFLLQRIGESACADVAAVASGTIGSYALPSPDDLEDKVALLKAIQFVHPALQCDTVRASTNDAGDTIPASISLSLDPLYVKLEKGGLAVDDCKRVMTFLVHGPLAPSAEAGVRLEQELTKEARTKVHRLFATATACLVTKTNAAQGIDVFFSPKMLQRRKRKQQFYVQFVLQKVDVDHFTALEALARAAKTPTSSFTYAGTKDKRAITTQRLVAQSVAPRALLDAHTALAPMGLAVGHLAYVATPLTLGQSGGNQFTIRLRNVEGTPDVVNAAFASVGATGFINYFGLQRVGSPLQSVRTHHVGQALFQRDYARAISLLFTSSDSDTPGLASAKTTFRSSRDVNAALRALPPSAVTERALLMGLKRYGADAHEKAVLNLPHHRRVMYLHAFQSLLFNLLASYRVATYGANVVAGDLVLDAATNSVCIVASADDATRCDLNDVVLPLFGSHTTVPTHAVGDYYKQVLSEHGISEHQAQQLKGAYRRVFCVPKDLHWTQTTENATVTVSFQLPPGSFATMLLREALKHMDFDATVGSNATE
ncbi:hypothetical protein SDRG_01977 [Saprolegnia diclina VS20]|uniref:TRUD domain-containing protein n=1 Tax=Saprolegnia diclina (strain VS20) TaxID=1156394 RepID=T0SDB0_SAPDV|nr:hypothetical protein SDRG_01977 [Saprolegnia diclina VS20]EQC40912.1 hypothetical protein SDRG_01977 [Saprolegnia diclina VS20]|eukprot:XP_008605756.1 hypothetical protein SDRG_01977 [Saprolegnia diclina VS20]